MFQLLKNWNGRLISFEYNSDKIYLLEEPPEISCHCFVHRAKSTFLDVFKKFSVRYENLSQLIAADESVNKYLLKEINILQAALEGIQILVPFWDTTPVSS